MVRKTPSKAAPKAAKNPQPKRAIDDNFVAPKLRKQKHVTLEEALAESGETIEELIAPPAPPADERPTRPAGTSNLANTIRAHRSKYTVALHPNGKKTQNNGDMVAQVLLFVPLTELKDFSAATFEGKRYDQLNPGHARMCIGNLIRGASKANNPVVVEWLEAKMKAIAEQGAEG